VFFGDRSSNNLSGMGGILQLLERNGLQQVLIELTKIILQQFSR